MIEIGRRHFAANGYSDATLKEIANESGLTTGAVYHYFSSKTDLFVTVADDTTRVLLDVLSDKVTDDMPFPENLRASFDAIAVTSAQIPNAAPFVVNLEIEAQRYPELRGVNDRLREDRDLIYREMILEAFRKGELNK